MIEKKHLLDKNKWVGGNRYHSLTKKDIFNIFRYEKYANITYLALSKGYTYQKECNRVLFADSRYNIHWLVGKGILEEFNLSDKQLQDLCLIYKIKKSSLKYIQGYRLTKEAKLYFENPFYYEMLIENCSNYALELKDELSNIYESNLEKEKQDWENRIRRAQIKNPRLRTAEDLALLELIKEK